MKNLFHFGIIAAALCLLFGCTREINTQTEEIQGTHSLTFMAQKDIDTRTYVVEGEGVASYYWSEGDDEFFHVYENGISAQSTTVTYSDDMKTATITATFANSSATEFSYTLKFAKTLSGSKNLLIPSDQNPVLDSYDPSADVLVSAEPLTLNGNVKADANTNLMFNLRRVASINKMTLKGLTPGEVIKTVELSSSDKYFSAYFQEAEADKEEKYNSESKTLTLDYTQLTNPTVGSDGTFPVYFVSAPVENATFSVKVTTDQNVYNRDNFASKLTFSVGKFYRFGINLSDYGEPISTGVEYELVVSQSDLESGAEYLIVGDGKRAMSVQNQNNRATVAVTPVDNIITIDNTIAANVFKLVPTGQYYFIEDVTEGSETLNQHLIANSRLTDSNNYLRSTTVNVGAAVWTITIEDGVASILCYDTEYKGVMCLNGEIISCYKELGSYKTLSLYKKDTRTKLNAPTSVSATINSSDDKVIDVTFSPVDGAASYVIVATPTTGDVITKTGITSSPASISVTDGLAFNTEYIISVYAVPTNTTDYRKSDATVAPNSVTTGGAPEGYELVTSLSDVTTGLYILAAKVDGDYFGMPKVLGTTPFASSQVSVNNGFVTNDDATNFVLTIIKDNGKYTIKGAEATLGYGSSTSFSTSATGNAALWTISEGVHGSFRIANFGTTTRAIALRADTSPSKFGAYATSNITSSSSYYDVELFKYNGTFVIKTDPTISVTPASPISLEVNGTQTLTVETNSDGTISFVSSNDDVVTVDEDGLISGISAGSATITISTAETDSFNAGSISVTVNVTAGSSSVAQVISGGAGTYKINNLLVYSVVGNQAIVGDNTGRMVLYKSGHGLKAGDIISIASATVAEHNGILQIQDGTFAKNSTGNAVDHGTATDLNNATVASTTYGTFSATGYHAATFVSMSGVQSGRNITGLNATLYLSTADATYDGKGVVVTGYIYYYNPTHSNYNFQLVSIEEDNTFPTISVSPASLSWAAAETDNKTLAVTLNGSAAAGDYTYSVTSGTSSDWTITKNNGTLSVAPNAANASTTDVKTITIKIAHANDDNVYQDVTCTQAKASSGGGGTLTLDFESATTSYNDWTFTNMLSQQTGSISAHGGTNYGTTGGKATASIVSKNKISSPGVLKVYFSKQSTNTTASTWSIQVSTDGSSWTTVKTQSASSMAKGEWVEVTQNLSSYSDVYVRVYYDGSTAVRNIDDLSLTYN